jgi:hypothetical protein
MAKWVSSRGGLFVEVGGGSYGLLIYSGVFLMLGWKML